MNDRATTRELTPDEADQIADSLHAIAKFMRESGAACRLWIEPEIGCRVGAQVELVAPGGETAKAFVCGCGHTLAQHDLGVLNSNLDACDRCSCIHYDGPMPATMAPSTRPGGGADGEM